MNSGPVLQVGSTGEDVRRLQRLFVEMKTLGAQDIDGNFGPKTKAAVTSFQSGSGLTADGIVGPLTWAQLPADPDVPELALGAAGSEVTALQTALEKFSAAGGVAATDPGPIDGSFGAKTDAAVRAFQAAAHVSVDGIVGDQTWFSPVGAAGATLASLAGLTTV